jgi:hypothetical protein
MLHWQRLQGQLTNNTPLMFGSYWGVEEVLLYFLDCLVDDAFNFDSWCVLYSFRVFCSWILNITPLSQQIVKIL